MTQGPSKGRTVGLAVAVAMAIVGGAFGATLAIISPAPSHPASIQVVQRASDRLPSVATVPPVVKIGKIANHTRTKAAGTPADETTSTEAQAPMTTVTSPTTDTTQPPPSTTEAVTTTTASADPTTTTEVVVPPTFPLPPAYSGPALIPSEVLTFTISDSSPTVGEQVTIGASLVDGSGNPVGIRWQQWAYNTAPAGVETGVISSGTAGSLAPSTVSAEWTFTVAGTYEIQCALNNSPAGFDAVATLTVTVTA